MNIPVEQIIEFFKAIMDRWGMKSIVTMVSCYFIYTLEAGSLLTWTSALSIVIITIGFFAFRHLELINSDCCECDGIEEENEPKGE